MLTVLPKADLIVSHLKTLQRRTPGSSAPRNSCSDGTPRDLGRTASGCHHGPYAHASTQLVVFSNLSIFTFTESEGEQVVMNNFLSMVA